MLVDLDFAPLVEGVKEMRMETVSARREPYTAIDDVSLHLFSIVSVHHLVINLSAKKKKKHTHTHTNKHV